MDTILENVSGDYLETVDATLARLNSARKEVAPKLEAALEKYIDAVRRDAALALNRPHWLLSRRLTTKVKNYKQNQKFWAIVGPARHQEGKRDPASYWRYHENAWFSKSRSKPSAPPRFLRNAMERHAGQLEKDVAEAHKEIREIFNRGS